MRSEGQIESGDRLSLSLPQGSKNWPGREEQPRFKRGSIKENGSAFSPTIGIKCLVILIRFPRHLEPILGLYCRNFQEKTFVGTDCHIPSNTSYKLISTNSVKVLSFCDPFRSNRFETCQKYWNNQFFFIMKPTQPGSHIVAFMYYLKLNCNFVVYIYFILNALSYYFGL